MEKESRAGKDYLVNHYSVLGVAIDASPKEISEQFKKLSQLYHPDKYSHLAAEFKKAAAEKFIAINQANEILSNPNLRAEFDQQLTNWKGPISEDGIPILVFSLNDEEIDDLSSKTETYLGLDSPASEFIETQFKSIPNPSEELKKAYWDILEKKTTFLAVKESFYLDKLGVDVKEGLSTSPAKGYLDKIGNRIAERRNQVEEIANSGLQLESKTTKAIGTEESLSEQTDEIQLYQAKTLADFDLVAEKAKEVAEQKRKIIEERLSLIELNYLSNPNNLSNKFLVVFIPAEGFNATFSWEFNPDKSLNSEDSCQNVTDEDIKTIINAGYSVVKYQHQEGLTIEEEIKTLAQKHYEAYVKLNRPDIDLEWK